MKYIIYHIYVTHIVLQCSCRKCYIRIYKLVVIVVFFQLFEGLKAFYGDDGKVRMFRPDMNCKRLNQSAEYACLPVSNEL